MKLVMDEKLKHRLIGLAVLISLGAIFAPAVMKKSSQRLDNNFSVNVKLPPKPIAPDVVMTDEQDMFKTIKIAKVNIESTPEQKQSSELIKAEPIKSNQINLNDEINLAQNQSAVNAEPIRLALNEAAKNTAKQVVHVVARKPIKPAPTIALKSKSTPKPIRPARLATATMKPAVKKDIYALQLASFSQITNAQSLVSRLRGKGYKANFSKISSRHGTVYKVYVGHSPRKVEVMKLKNQLASAMQLNGFVVNTGVS